MLCQKQLNGYFIALIISWFLPLSVSMVIQVLQNGGPDCIFAVSKLKSARRNLEACSTGHAVEQPVAP